MEARRERRKEERKSKSAEIMHQPVLSVSEEVNFHASGWTMWTARFCSSDHGASTLFLHGDKQGGHTSRRDAKKKYISEKQQRRKESEKQINLRSKDHYFFKRRKSLLVKSLFLFPLLCASSLLGVAPLEWSRNNTAAKNSATEGKLQREKQRASLWCSSLAAPAFTGFLLKEARSARKISPLVCTFWHPVLLLAWKSGLNHLGWARVCVKCVWQGDSLLRYRNASKAGALNRGAQLSVIAGSLSLY